MQCQDVMAYISHRSEVLMSQLVDSGRPIPPGTISKELDICKSKYQCVLRKLVTEMVINKQRSCMTRVNDWRSWTTSLVKYYQIPGVFLFHQCSFVLIVYI